MLELPKITQTIGRLIDALYSVDDREVLFRTFCCGLKAMVPFSAAAVAPIDGRSRALSLENHLRYGMEEGDVAALCEAAASCHPVMQSSVYRALLAGRKNLPVRVTDILPLPQLMASEYFRLFLSRRSALHELFAVLGVKKNLVGALLLLRPKGAGEFSDRDRQVVALLLPHLARALQHADAEQAAAQPAVLPQGLPLCHGNVLSARKAGDRPAWAAVPPSLSSSARQRQ